MSRTAKLGAAARMENIGIFLQSSLGLSPDDELLDASEISVVRLSERGNG